LTGEYVTDLVHLYGLARAGYIPELFSLKFSLPGQAVVRDLLNECNGKALVYDQHFTSLVDGIALPSFPLVDISKLPLASTLFGLPNVSSEDIAIIFHTSGTTGGRPKPVPQTHKWCKTHSMVCWKGIWQGEFDTPDVVNNIGSFAHMGASTCTLSLQAFAI
jgi:acyl-coenzyme A synthetase/AMP-(fatty) acid ligase